MPIDAVGCSAATGRVDCVDGVVSPSRADGVAPSFGTAVTIRFLLVRTASLSFLIREDTGWDPGAATIGALRAIARRILRRLRQQPGAVLPSTIHDVLRNRRILILHCGGDARRMPPYAAIGKIFVPLPPDLRPPDAPSSQSTLF